MADEGRETMGVGRGSVELRVDEKTMGGGSMLPIVVHSLSPRRIVPEAPTHSPRR